MAVPTPTSATGSHFYRYSGPDHLEWLKVVIPEHELYLPRLDQLNDPADGRPKLAPLSEDQLASFLYNDFIKRDSGLTRDVQEQEQMKIRYNIRVHGAETLMGHMAKMMNSELEDWRIYSMSKRYDNMGLWAKYAANHTGYCLEFANEGPLFAHTKEVTYGDSIEMDLNNSEHRSGYWFFNKRQDWSNEEEVRLVLPRGNPCKVRIEPRWLTRVILGKNMSSTNQQLVCKWAEQRKPKLTVISATYNELSQALTLSL